MSDYHIKIQTKLAHQVEVVFHISVPDELNSALKSLRDCIKEDLSPTTIVPWLVDPELTQVFNGEIYEHREAFQFSNAKDTLAAKKIELDARWSVLSVSVLNRLRIAYEWWGRDEDV